MYQLIFTSVLLLHLSTYGQDENLDINYVDQSHTTQLGEWGYQLFDSKNIENYVIKPKQRLKIGNLLGFCRHDIVLNITNKAEEIIDNCVLSLENDRKTVNYFNRVLDYARKNGKNVFIKMEPFGSIDKTNIKVLRK